MHRLALFALLGALSGLACSSSAVQEEVVAAPAETEALFAFAPEDAEVVLVAHDLDLLLAHGGGALTHLSRVPVLARELEELEEWSETKLERKVFDPTFLSNLGVAPERGAALFLVHRSGGTAALGVIALREGDTSSVIGKLARLGRTYFDTEMSIEKRSGEGPTLYTVGAIAGKLPELVISVQDGFLLVSTQEDLVKKSADPASRSPSLWSQAKERSPLVKEPHDAFVFVNFDGRLGTQLREQYGSAPLGGDFVKSWLAASASLRVQGDVVWLRGYLATPQGKDLKPYFERSEGRGDLLAVGDENTSTALRLTLNPARLWRRLSELPSSSADSPSRLAERFQAETGVRLSDPENGVLEHLSGEIAYLSEPGLGSAALLFGIHHNKPAPFEQLLAAFWRLGETALRDNAEILNKARLEFVPSAPSTEGGHTSYRLQVRHRDIPFAFTLEATTTRDAVVFGLGPGWLGRASSRTGKNANAFYKRLYHPDVRALFAREPQAMAYLQFTDPAEGMESTPGEVTQALAAYSADPELGTQVALFRNALDRLFDAALAFFVYDGGVELVVRVTTL